jgi:uncharacterized membrane protein YdjX (TVP38/TMEM64 family)
MNLKQAKKIIHYIWIGLVIVGLFFLIINPDAFSVKGISAFLKKSGHWVWLVYIIITLLRGLLLFPSTPFVLAGAILFPDQLILVGVVSMLGILSSATLLYYFADRFGFGDYLYKKAPHRIEKAHIELNKPKGKWLVAAWAWFPFVPTDIICYVAGLVKMRYSIMITGIFLGEAILISLYLYLGKDILHFL